MSGMIKEDFISVKRKIYKKLEAAASRTSASINVSALSKPALLCGILIGLKTLFRSEEIQCDKDAAAAAVFRSPATDYRHQSIYSSRHYCHMSGTQLSALQRELLNPCLTMSSLTARLISTHLSLNLIFIEETIIVGEALLFHDIALTLMVEVKHEAFPFCFSRSGIQTITILSWK